MSVRSGQSITVLFTTRAFSTGAATNADSTPAGTLYVNGTADAASVTVTNITTGVYKAAVTLPTLAVGDVVDLRIAATVSSVSDNAIVWRDSKDVALDGSGRTTDVNSANLDAAVSTRSTYAGGDTSGVTALLGRVAAAGMMLVAQPQTSGTALTLVRGDDYKSNDGRDLRWAGGAWPDLTSATVSLVVGSTTFTGAGSVIVATGSLQQVRVELTAAQTATLSTGFNVAYRVVATLSSGRVATLAAGYASVL